MAPLPPEPPLDDVAFALSAVQAGQTVMVDGVESLAIKDEVILTVVVNGTPSRSFRMTPEEALQVGAGLGQMAGKLINAEVDDNGRPTGFIHRLSRINAGRILPGTLSPDKLDPRTIPGNRMTPDMVDAMEKTQALLQANLRRTLSETERTLPPETADYFDPRTTMKDEAPINPNLPKEVSRVPFVAESDTDGDIFAPGSQVPIRRPDDEGDDDEPVTFSRGAFGGPKHRHNHFTRGLTYGCPACTDYMQKHGIPEETE